MSGDDASEVSSVQPTTNAGSHVDDGSVTSDSEDCVEGESSLGSSSQGELEEGWILKSTNVRKGRRKSRSRSPRPHVATRPRREAAATDAPCATADDQGAPPPALSTSYMNTSLLEDGSMPEVPAVRHEWTAARVEPSLREDFWPPQSAHASEHTSTATALPGGAKTPVRRPPHSAARSGSVQSAQRELGSKVLPARYASPVTPRRTGSLGGAPAAGPRTSGARRTKPETLTGAASTQRPLRSSLSSAHRSDSITKRTQSPVGAGGVRISRPTTPAARTSTPGRRAPPPPTSAGDPSTPRMTVRRPGSVVGSATILTRTGSPATRGSPAPRHDGGHASLRTSSPLHRTMTSGTRTASPVSPAATRRSSSHGHSTVRRVAAGVGLPANRDMRLDTAQLRKMTGPGRRSPITVRPGGRYVSTVADAAAAPTPLSSRTRSPPASARGRAAAARPRTPVGGGRTSSLTAQHRTHSSASADAGAGGGAGYASPPPAGTTVDPLLGEYPDGLLDAAGEGDERRDCRVVATVCGVPAHSHMVRYAASPPPTSPRKRRVVEAPVDARTPPAVEATGKPLIPLVVSPAGRYAVTVSPEAGFSIPAEKRNVSPPRTRSSDACPPVVEHPLPGFTLPFDRCDPAGSADATSEGGGDAVATSVRRSVDAQKQQQLLYTTTTDLYSLVAAAREAGAGPVPATLQLQLVESLERLDVHRDELRSYFRLTQDLHRTTTALVRRHGAGASMLVSPAVQREKERLQQECESKLQALRATHDQYVFEEEMLLADMGGAPEVEGRRTELRRVCALHYAKLASLRAQYGERQAALGDGVPAAAVTETDYEATIEQLDDLGRHLEEELDNLLEMEAAAAPGGDACPAPAQPPPHLIAGLLRLMEAEGDARLYLLEEEACAIAKLLGSMHTELLRLILTRPKAVAATGVAHPHAPPEPRATVSASPAVDFILSPSVGPESERAKSLSVPPARPPPPVPLDDPTHAMHEHAARGSYPPRVASGSPSPQRLTRYRTSSRDTSPRHGVRDLRGKTPPHLTGPRASESHTPMSISPSPGMERERERERERDQQATLYDMASASRHHHHNHPSQHYDPRAPTPSDEGERSLLATLPMGMGGPGMRLDMGADIERPLPPSEVPHAPLAAEDGAAPAPAAPPPAATDTAPTAADGDAHPADIEPQTPPDGTRPHRSRRASLNRADWQWSSRVVGKRDKDRDSAAGSEATRSEPRTPTSPTRGQPATPTPVSRLEERRRACRAARGTAKGTRVAAKPTRRGGADQPPEFAAYASIDHTAYDTSIAHASPAAAVVDSGEPPKWKQLVQQLHSSSLGPVREIFEKLQTSQAQSRTEERSRVLDELRRELQQAAQATSVPTPASLADPSVVVRTYDTAGRSISRAVGSAGARRGGAQPAQRRGGVRGMNTQRGSPERHGPGRRGGSASPARSPARSTASRGGDGGVSPRGRDPRVWRTGCGDTGYVSRSPSPPVHHAAFSSAFPERY